MIKSSQARVLLLCCVLGGCAASTAVVSAGNGTYKAVRRAANGFTKPGTLRYEAVQAANDYCGKQHQAALILSVQEPPPPYWFGNFPQAEAVFSCRDARAPGNGAS